MYNKACCFDLEYNNELKMNDKLEENAFTLSADNIHEDCNV
jgi:hypothetical protein